MFTRNKRDSPRLSRDLSLNSYFEEDTKMEFKYMPLYNKLSTIHRCSYSTTKGKSIATSIEPLQIGRIQDATQLTHESDIKARLDVKPSLELQRKIQLFNEDVQDIEVYSYNRDSEYTYNSSIYTKLNFNQVPKSHFSIKSEKSINKLKDHSEYSSDVSKSTKSTQNTNLKLDSIYNLESIKFTNPKLRNVHI